MKEVEPKISYRIPSKEEIEEAGLSQKYTFRREGSSYEGESGPLLLGQTFVRLFSMDSAQGWFASSGCSYQILTGPAKGIVLRTKSMSDFSLISRYLNALEQLPKDR